MSQDGIGSTVRVRQFCALSPIAANIATDQQNMQQQYDSLNNDVINDVALYHLEV